MADRVELLEAMKVIQGYCTGYCCVGCSIMEECIEYFKYAPSSWDLEDGEENEG